MKALEAFERSGVVVIVDVVANTKVLVIVEARVVVEPGFFCPSAATAAAVTNRRRCSVQGPLLIRIRSLQPVFPNDCFIIIVVATIVFLILVVVEAVLILIMGVIAVVFVEIVSSIPLLPIVAALVVNVVIVIVEVVGVWFGS